MMKRTPCVAALWSAGCLSLALATPVLAQDATVTLKGGPTIESADGNYKFSIGSSIHLDAAAYDEDGAAMDNGFLFRRARLAINATLFKNWQVKTQYDFAENGVGFADVYMRYSGIKGVKITAGQFKMPFGLNELTSSNGTTFIEVASPMVFAASRRIGFSVDVAQPLFTVSAAVYGRNVGGSTAGDDPLALGGRVTFAPINDKGRVLHVGGAAAYEWTDDANTVRIRQRPESRVDGARFVDTGSFVNASSQFKYGLELAGIYGPFSLQGEYMGSNIKRTTGLPSIDLNGFYVMGSWVLSGESRGYRDGLFRGVSPSRDIGAFEVAARYSTLDLNDTGIVSGGNMKNITLGTNWYINRNVRMMLNYVRVNTDALGPRSDDPNIFQLRLQANF
jgi:phosphate-selective porin OprO and OprP